MNSRGCPRWVIVILVATAMLGCSKPTYYSADAINARVIDADTREPLADVNVVAGWEVKGGLEGGNTMGWVMVMESVTDASGTFTFPAWGPKRLNVNGAITDGSPVLLLFRSGYSYQRLYDRSRRVGDLAPFSRDERVLNPMRSYWNGKTIPFQRFAAGDEEYAESLQMLQIDINSILRTKDCNFRMMPKFLLAVDRQSKIFAGEKTKWRLDSAEGLGISYSHQCGSLQRFVEEHGR